ncbi:hypothetical protein IEU95_00370 [Hoyosella rhizosphaerae]|uniref:hypothetical protein n=1 Tax=Hoyosella rhizosphaerae TaxID=1755582 RepID=UPI00197FD0C3|nr:hypothetical protein [Hoyosella rhizosphaerae]MBN4925274.1 hypothetical protein [Hoyosella rhizosphaerae]
MDDTVAAAISALDADDPAVAADAECAWHELVAISPASGPIQASVQQYCWGTLRRLDLGTERAWARSCALADLLDRIGLSRYAHIARSDTTRAMLSPQSQESWVQRFRAHMAESGVAPPNTTLLSWPDVCTVRELDIVDTIASTLEVAVITGDIPVGAHRNGSAARREEIMHSVLATERGDQNLLEDVLDCRIELWSTLSPTRAAVYDGLVEVLHAAQVVPLVVAQKAHRYLSELRASHDAAESPSESADDRQLRLILQRMGLVRRERGRTVLRPHARGMSIADVVSVLLRDWIGVEYTPEAVVIEALLVAVARTGDTSFSAYRADRIDPAVLATALLNEEGWRVGGEPIGVRDVRKIVNRAIHELQVLGVLTDDSEDIPYGNSIAVMFAHGVIRARLLHSNYPRAM